MVQDLDFIETVLAIGSEITEMTYQNLLP